MSEVLYLGGSLYLAGLASGFLFATLNLWWMNVVMTVIVTATIWRLKE